MTFIAKVHNGAILLPPGIELPDGAEVKVATPDIVSPPQLPRSSHAWMESFIGSVEGPEDFAAEHDHYIHGTPKRARP
jgi:hypothetical protein